MYAQINAALIAAYMVACGVAFLLSRDDKDAWEQVAAYAVTIFVFQVLVDIFHISPHDMGFWWYLVNAGVDAYIVAYAWRCKAAASKWVWRVGMAATAVDLLYFFCAGSGHKLPGLWYFASGNVFRTLQVIALILFSGPVMPALHKHSHRIASLASRLFNGKHSRVIAHS